MASVKILWTTERITIKFLPDVHCHREAENKKKMDITHLACKLWSKKPQIACFLKMQLLDMLTSQHFAGSSILTSEITLKISDQPLKGWLIYGTICHGWSVRYKTAYKMHSRSHDLTNLLGDVMSLISRHWPSFKYFWWVQLKPALYKGQTRGQILRKSVQYCINWKNF